MIIWNNLKVTNGTHTVTISAADGISGKLNSVTGSIGTSTQPVIGYFSGTLSNASGTINASGTFSGSLDHATGTIAAGGTFSGRLINTIGSVNNITCNGLTTINAVNFTQSVNLPANSTIVGAPIQFAETIPNDVGVIMLIGTGDFGDKIYLCNCSYETRSISVQIKTHNNDNSASQTDTLNFNQTPPYQWKYVSPMLTYDNVEEVSINGILLTLKSGYPEWLQPATGSDEHNYYAYLIQEHNTSTVNKKVLKINNNLIGIPYYGILSTITYNHSCHYTIPTQSFSLPASFEIDQLS